MAIQIDKTKIRPINSTDLDFLREMRCDSEVNKFLQSQDEISTEKQEHWYTKKYQKKISNQRFMVLQGNKRAGEVSLAGINLRERHAEGGVVFIKKYWNTPATVNGLFLIHYYGFRLLGLATIYGRGRVANIRTHEILDRKSGCVTINEEKMPADLLKLGLVKGHKFHEITRDEWEAAFQDRIPSVRFVNEILRNHFPKE